MSEPGSRRVGKRWLWVVAAAAALVAVSAAVLSLRHGRVSSPDVAAAAQLTGRPGSGVPAATPLGNLSPEERREAYDLRIAGLRAQITRTQALVDRFPKELVDLDALARSLPTAESAFVFVRDRIAFEPYTGVMKGAVGTLLSRGGNAIDRALLLAAILARNGVTPRIVQGALPRAQAESLLQQVAGTPDAVERIAGTIPTLPQRPAPTVGVRQAANSLESEAGTRARARHGQAVSSLQQLLASLEAAGVPPDRNRREEQLSALEDHYWVQASIGGQQVDLDPSIKTAALHQRFAEPAGTFSPDTLPAALHHRIGISVVADVLENGAIASRELVRADARSIDLVGRNIRVAVEPQALARAQNAYSVTVVMGDKPPVTAAFELRSAAPAPPPGGATGGLLGGLGGDEPAEPTTQDPAGAVLGRLTVEVVATAPTLGEVRHRRVVMDRLEGEPQSPRLLEGMESDDSVRGLLLQVWDGAIAVGATQPVQLFASQLQALTSEQSTTEQALAEVYLGRSMGTEMAGQPPVPPELLGFFFYSSLTRHVLVAADRGGGRVFQLRPRIAFMRHGGAIHDWSRVDGKRRLQRGIDLINLPYDLAGGRDAAAGLRVTMGVVDTALERAFAGQSGDFNTVSLDDAARNQKIPFVTLGPGESAGVDRIAAPEPIRRVLRDAVSHGRALIVPTSLVALSQVRTLGWWSIDPESGVPLGQMELGAGQAVSETAALNKAILTGGHTFSKFYGGMLGCFYVEAADQLVPPDGPYEVTPTFNWSKGHYIPGMPTIASGQGLPACLVEKMCEAVIEYAFLAAESAAWVGDLTNLQHHIVEILGLVGPTAVATWAGGCHQGGGEGGESGGH